MEAIKVKEKNNKEMKEGIKEIPFGIKHSLKGLKK